MADPAPRASQGQPERSRPGWRVEGARSPLEECEEACRIAGIGRTPSSATAQV